MSDESRISVVIVDDEEPARDLLRAWLAQMANVEIAGEAPDGPAALRVIADTSPELVLLDVQMPGMSGLDVAARLVETASPPLIVFVTAYDQYALKAFEVSACDYLLKPFDAERLAATMERVMRRQASTTTGTAEIQALLRRLTAAADRPIVLKTGGRHVFVDAREIEWIEMDGKAARVHLVSGNAPVVVREPMSALESKLDPDTFVRVHRGAIVNRRHIRELQPWFKGDYVIILRRGARVTSGRTYRDAVRRLIGAEG